MIIYSYYISATEHTYLQSTSVILFNFMKAHKIKVAIWARKLKLLESQHPKLVRGCYVPFVSSSTGNKLNHPENGLEPLQNCDLERQ